MEICDSSCLPEDRGGVWQKRPGRVMCAAASLPQMVWNFNILLSAEIRDTFDTLPFIDCQLIMQ